MGLIQKLFKKNSIRSTLMLDSNGRHTIGGKAPVDLQIPKLESSPIVYFGCVKKNDPVLPLMDFDLHLMAPIFINMGYPVFFDYSNPLQPKLILKNVTSDFTQYFDDIPASTYIEYKELRFNFDQTKDPDGIYENGFGATGKPNWIQDEQWLNCPVTGNKMKFLIQLGDIDLCTTVIGQEILDKESIDPYLHFGHGYLYIFFEPESKVVGYINQIS